MSIIYDETSGKRKVSTKTVGSTTYGISIADLQSITGSSKRDLMLLHCESQNGVGTESEEEYISKGDTKIRSAFALGDMSVPTGWTKHTKTGRKKGDLVIEVDGADITQKVASPRWNLWADHVNFGKFVLNSGTAQSPNYHFQYNLFCPLNRHPLKNDGTPAMPNGMGAPNLEQWQDYCDTEASEPKATLSDNVLSMEFHNGVYAPLANALENRIYPLNSDLDKRDDCCVWLNPRTDLAQGIGALGNLIDWDFNTGHSTRCAVPSVITDYDFTNDNGIDVYGVAIDVTEAGNASQPHRIARGYKTQASVLKNGVSQALKNEYRDGASFPLEYASQFGGALYGRFLDFYNDTDKTSSLPAKATLSMVLSNIGEGQGDVNGSYMVETSRVLSPLGMTINAVFDTKVLSSTPDNARTIMTTRGTQNIDSYICTSDGAVFRFVRNDLNNNRLGGFCMPFYFWGKQSNSVVHGDNIAAFVELSSVEMQTINNVTKPVPKEYHRVYTSLTNMVDMSQSSPFYTGIGNLTSGIVLPNGKEWSNNQQETRTGYQYVAPENARVLYISNNDLYSPTNTASQLSTNTTAVVTLYDRNRCVTVDVYSYDFLDSAAPRCPIDGTIRHGYFMYLGNRYVASNSTYSHIFDIGMENSSTTITYTTDFLRYNTLTDRVYNSDISTMDGMKVALYNNGTKIGDITLSYNSSTQKLTGSVVVNGKQYDAEVWWGDMRMAANIDGTFASSVDVCTLKLTLPVSNRQANASGTIKEADNIRFALTD